MDGIKQNTLATAKAYQRLRGVEHRGCGGGFASVWITENNAVIPPEEDDLLGKILCPYNLNKGSHGVDGLNVESLKNYLVNHGSELVCSIRNWKYRPNLVRRVEIPKDVHSKRPLGIPTVVDRLVK